MKLSVYIFCFVVSLSMMQTASSQDKLSPYVKNWNVESGLVDNHIYSLAEDPFKRIWAGTPNGVSIIDGLGIINLNKDDENQNAISSNVITNIFQHQKKMWVLSLNGIDIVDPLTLKAKAISDPKKLLSRANNILFVNNSNALVIANRRLVNLSLTDHTLSYVKEFEAMENIQWLYALTENELIISNLKGYFRFNLTNKEVTPYFFEDFDRKNEDVRASTVDKQGKLWLSVFGKGIFVFEQERLVKRFYSANGSLTSDMVSKLFQQGEKLLAITARGVEVFDPINLQRIHSILPRSKGNSFLSADMALTAFVHSDASLIIGTTQGVFRLPKTSEKFRWLSDLVNMNKDFHIEQTFIKDKKLHVITRNKVYQINESAKVKEHSKLEVSTSIKRKLTSLYHDGGTFLAEHNQLTFYQSGQFINASIEGLPEGMQLSSIYQIMSSDYYILISNAELFLAKKQGNKVIIKFQRHLGTANIVDVEVVNGIVFIANQKKGVLSIPYQDLTNNEKSFTLIPGPEVPIDLYTDSKGVLWVLTFDNGLYSLATNSDVLSFKPFKVANNLSHLKPICMVEDQQNRFWFASRYGLSVVEPKTQTINSFGENDGIKPQAFHRFECGRLDNKLYFASDNNVLFVNSNDISLASEQLKLAFNYVVEDNNTLNINEKDVFIEPSILTFSLVSASLNLGDEDKLYYRVKEDINEFNLSKGLWRLAPSRDITLIKPKTGDYNLEAKVRRNDGNESNVASISFTVTVPFLLSPLMLSVYVLALIALLNLLFFYKLQLKNSQLKVARINSFQQKKYSEKLTLEVANKTAQYKEQQQIAVKANIDKTRFIASASHDLRAPLNAIRWKLEKVLDDESKDKQRVMEEIILLDKLVESIVNLSKFDAKIITANLQPFSLKGLVDEVVHRFSDYIIRHNMSLVIDIPDIEIYVLSDRFLLARLINNIVDNSLKNMEDFNVLTIKVNLRQQSVNFFIGDSGPGIPEHIKTRAFDSFVRGTEKYAGSGLGLTIVKQIADILALDLSISSNDSGTNFSMTLSLAEVAIKKESVSNIVKTALIIDDDSFYANEINLLLTTLSFQVKMITDMTLLETESFADHYQLLICDFNLGLSTNGLEVIDSLLNQKKVEAEQVIVVSEDPQVRELMLKNQHYYFLNKPLKRSRLSWILQQAG